jgi:hypothetical protein
MVIGAIAGSLVLWKQSQQKSPAPLTIRWVLQPTSGTYLYERKIIQSNRESAADEPGTAFITTLFLH